MGLLMEKSTPNQQEIISRRDIRGIVFHILYALDSFEYTIAIEEIVESFNKEFELSIDPEGDAVRMVRGVVEHRTELDQRLIPLFSNWRPERIGTCTHLILLMATWEYFFEKTPGTVIINEAIELTKNFSEKDAYKFVNGVLDELFKRNPEQRPEAHHKPSHTNETSCLVQPIVIPDDMSSTTELTHNEDIEK